MLNKTPTIEIRLLGFSAKEEETFFSVLAVVREKGYRYSCLKKGCLRDPDMFIVNADELKALADLSDIHPGEAQPVLLVGKTDIDLPYPSISRPIRWRKIFDILDELIDKRELLLTTLSAYTSISVHERRHTKRLDLDLSDPSIYKKMREQPKGAGGILVVDKDTQFREYVSTIMDRYGKEVSLASDERGAIMLHANHQHVLTLINTSTPNIDPYHLCDVLKKQSPAFKIYVIFLVDKDFNYDLSRGNRVGCEGFLVKPLSRKILLKTIKKFLQLG